jgi:hypothetical protein
LVVEFAENPGYFCLVCAVVKHDDYSLVLEDHLAKGRPVGDIHGSRRWCPDILHHARVFEGCDVIGYGISIALAVVVAHHDCDNFIWVRVEPALYGGQVGFERADIEQIAGGMAEANCG